MTRYTIVYAPHQDDETLRLTGYIRSIKALRPQEKYILVAVTDGEASGTRGSMGLSVSQFKAIRRAEQAAAWSYLTDDGEVIRLGLPDGGVSGHKEKIAAVARELEARYGRGNVEHYAACRTDDYHADHRAVAEALRDAGLRVVRYSRQPGESGGTAYRPTAGYLWGAERAAEAYREAGQRSVPEYFRALRDSGYASHITS